MKHRRYKADYERLYDDPTALFGSGVETILWPNGAPQIWIRDTRGSGVRIQASAGPQGICLFLRRFTGGAPLTVFRPVEMGKDGRPKPGRGYDEYDYLEVTQYLPGSEAFRDWYAGLGPHPGKGASEGRNP